MVYDDNDEGDQYKEVKIGLLESELLNCLIFLIGSVPIMKPVNTFVAFSVKGIVLCSRGVFQVQTG